MLVSKPGDHQFAHRQIDERLAAGVCPLKIAREPAMVRDPGVRTLNDPSFGKKVEALGNDLVPVHLRSYRGIRALNASPWVIDNLQVDPIEVFFHPYLKGPLIGAISPHEPETREVSDQSGEQDLAPFEGP
jgi:hypothetical protein